MKYPLIISLLLITGCNTYNDLSEADKVKYVCNKDNFLVKRGMYIMNNNVYTHSRLITNDSNTPTRCGNASIKVYETVETGSLSGDVNVNDNPKN